MKLSELKPCGVCRGKIVPIWYVVRASQAMLKPSAANSTLGLLQHFGGMHNPGALAVAEAMSPDPDCVMIFGDADPHLMTEIFICQQCALMKDINLAMLMESSRDSESESVNV